VGSLLTIVRLAIVMIAGPQIITWRCLAISA